MRRAVFVLGFCLSASVWADDIYWCNGQVWRGVTVGEITWSSAGMVVEVATAPSWSQPGVYGGAMRITRPIRPAPGGGFPIVPGRPALSGEQIEAAVRRAVPLRGIPIVRARVVWTGAISTGIVAPQPEFEPDRVFVANTLYDIRGTVYNGMNYPIASIDLELRIYRGRTLLVTYDHTVTDIPVGESKSFGVPIMGRYSTRETVRCRIVRVEND